MASAPTTLPRRYLHGGHGHRRDAESARGRPGIDFVDAASVAKAASSPTAKAIVEDRPCNVVVACARSVGQQLGAKWVVMGKISKTSDLIWIFSGELIDVASGKLVLDDSYELKGIAKDMVPKGAEVFARRVAKKVSVGQRGRAVRIASRLASRLASRADRRRR